MTESSTSPITANFGAVCASADTSDCSTCDDWGQWRWRYW